MRNRNTLKFKMSNAGYTLVELAIVIAIMGILIGPAAGLYKLYQIDQKQEKTQDVLSRSVNSIGGFQTVQGRYPCPSSMTAVPGDDEYGHEVCVEPVGERCMSCYVPAIGDCDRGVCAEASIRVDTGPPGFPSPFRTVLRGNLPFKKMNLQEGQAYDGQGHRLTYAVTAVLTDPTEFNRAMGGVELVDIDGDSVLEVPGSAQFVVLSHGDNDAGAITRDGVEVEPCPTAGAGVLEDENCDADSIFRVGGKENDFDDQVVYTSSIETAEWQTSVEDPRDIHVRNARSIAIGAQINENLGDAPEATIRSLFADSGVVLAEGGNFLTNRLCKYGSDDTGDCFQPRKIGGDHTDPDDTGGMKCPDGEFMIGIKDGEPLCNDEIFVSCARNEFIAGFSTDGEVICGGKPPPPCAPMDVTASCGGDRTVPSTPEGSWGLVYDGTCYMRPNTPTQAEIDAFFSVPRTGDEADAWADELNSLSLVETDCGPEESFSLIRDAYQCIDKKFEYVRTHEIGHPPDYVSPDDPSHTAEMDVDWFPGVDPYSGGNQNIHDCWCQEDYRMYRAGNCGDGLSGYNIYFQKHICPKTDNGWNGWTGLYTERGGSNCVCAEGEELLAKSCDDYYGTINGLKGDVILTYDRTCDADGNPVISDTPSSVDTSQCYCPYRDDQINPVDCPEHTTNEWSWSGINATYDFVAVEKITPTEWECPMGHGFMTNVPSTEGAKWGGRMKIHEPPTIFGPACLCEDYDVIEHEECPSDQQGSGYNVRKRWICALDDFEPDANWEIFNDDCKSCSIQQPDGTADIVSTPAGPSPGDYCACGSDREPVCSESNAGNGFKQWNGCTCEVNQ